MLPNMEIASQQLNNALIAYDKKCLKIAAGSEGIERRKQFVTLANKLTLSKTQDDFRVICEFYLKQKPTSRLRDEIRNSLKTIFGIKEPKAEPEKYLYSGKTGRYLQQHPQLYLDRQIREAINTLSYPKPINTIELQIRGTDSKPLGCKL